MHKYLILSLFAILFLVIPASAELVQFWPDKGSIGSTDVRDICDWTREDIYFATTNGISVYDGEIWEILHAMPKDRRGYLEGIPLNNYVLEIESDYLNRIWLGYSNGIQIYNGYSKPFTIRQPDDIFVECSINKIKRQNRIMWIATGDSGIYYYYNGRFTWVKPGEETGLLGYHINDIEIDYSGGVLYLASTSNGQFIYDGGTEELNNITFKKISHPLISSDMTEIVSHPKGGMIFFNNTDVVRYTGVSPGEHIFSVKDLSEYTNRINDLAITENGRYLAGTDNGIFIWYKGDVLEHLTKFDGLSSNRIKKVFVDNDQRCWFTTRDTVGYFFERGFTAYSSIELDPGSYDPGYPVVSNILTET